MPASNKARRDAERVLESLGLTIIDKGTGGRHFYFTCRTQDGRVFKQPLATSTEKPNFWGNFKSQARKNINGA
jgi:hypothetical protein